MITKNQWNELCEKIRTKRKEDKDVYFGKHQHNIQACFAFRNIILISDENNTKLTHKSFPNQSFRQVKEQFYWVEIHNMNEF